MNSREGILTREGCSKKSFKIYLDYAVNSSQKLFGMDELSYWVALRMVTGVGEVLYRNLISKFQTPKYVFEANPRELQKVDGIGEKTIYSIKNFSEWDKAQKEVSRLKKLDLQIITLADAEYPKNLLNTYNPPPFLYVKGEVRPEDDLAVAIVGTRVPDRYGRAVAEQLTVELAARGITIVSGMARGIDSIAHSVALKRGGRTIAVLGSGLDVVYPPENKKLFDAISKCGAVISELPIGTAPDSLNFPKRNRIISGLSLGVVVVQASHKSGSLITASFAVEQNREVFAVPGNVGIQLSQGANRLIKKGAKLIESVEDIIVEIEAFSRLTGQTAPDDNNLFLSRLTSDEKLVYSIFQDRSLHVDEIIKLTHMDTSRVLSLLLSLELGGFLTQLPGKMFRLRKQ